MNKPVIIPALLCSGFYDIERQVTFVGDHVKTVQLDLVDGKFAPNTTWWFSGKNLQQKEEILREERGLPLWETLNYEVDLMLYEPLAHIDEVIALGPSRIIFHLSSIKDDELAAWFEKLSPVVASMISFSIAVRYGDELEKLKQYEAYIDDIQCMGIKKVGFQRQPFDQSVLEQIAVVKVLFPTKTITVDGAVSEETIGLLWNAGATRFAVGSALFQSVDLLGTLHTLRSICLNTPTQHEN